MVGILSTDWCKKMYKLLYETGGDVVTEYTEDKVALISKIESNGGEVLHVETVDQPTWITNKTIYQILSRFDFDKEDEKFIKKKLWTMNKVIRGKKA